MFCKKRLQVADNKGKALQKGATREFKSAQADESEGVRSGRVRKEGYLSS